MGQRIKGQEVEVTLILDGQPQDSINAVKSASIEFKMDLKEEGFLGETTNRYDDVFNGVKGDITLQYDTPAVFNVISSIINRARRRTPGVKINIKMVLSFPSGQRARVVLRDVSFGAIPLDFGARTDYGSIKLDYACSDGQVIA